MSKSKQPNRKRSDSLIMNRLAIVMKEDRVTNRSLAALIDYEEATVSKWVTNSVQPPLATFYRIALVLRRDLQELFVSTKNVTDAARDEQLKYLEKLAVKGKRTGKSKE